MMLSYEEKVNEYIIQAKKIGRKLYKSDQFFFSDGTSMYDWYNFYCRYMKNNIDDMENLVKRKKMELFAYLENILYDLGSIKDCKKKLTMEEATIEYIIQVQKMGRNMRQTDANLFSDGRCMYDWYHNCKSMIRKKNLKDDHIEVQKIKQIDEIIEIIQREKYEQKILQHMKEYLVKVNELDRNLTYNDKFSFEDGTDMFYWYTQFTKMDQSFFTEKIQQKINLFFSKVDEIKEKNPNFRSLTLEERLDQYLTVLKKCEGRIKARDQVCFTDHVLMKNWYFKLSHQNQKKVRNNQVFTQHDIEKAWILAIIDNEIYEFEKKKIINEIEQTINRINKKRINQKKYQKKKN